MHMSFYLVSEKSASITESLEFEFPPSAFVLSEVEVEEYTYFPISISSFCKSDDKVLISSKLSS